MRNCLFWITETLQERDDRCLSNVSVLFRAARGRKRPRPGAIARTARRNPLARFPPVRVTPPAARPRLAPMPEPKDEDPRPTCLHPRAPSLPNPWGGTFLPDRFQPAAVLGPVKAWPGSVRACGEAGAPASLRQPLRAAAECDRGSGRRNGAFRSNKETDHCINWPYNARGQPVPAALLRWLGSARFAWPFPNQCNKGLTRNCGPVRGAYWAHLTNICRKPTLFFHDPSQSCTIYLLDRLFVSKADFAANVSLARKGALVMRSPNSWSLPEVPAIAREFSFPTASSPCKMIGRGRAASRH